MKSIKLLITTSLLAIPFYEANANANLQYEVVSPQFQSQVQTLSATMTTNFATTQANLLYAIQENTRQISSAISVAVTQSSAGATQVIDARKNAAQGLATAIQAIGQQDKIIDTVLSYGSTGQGYNTCW